MQDSYKDTHVHYSGDAVSGTAKSILKIMDEVGVERIALISMWGKDLGEQEKNIEQAHKVISECPDRLYGLAWIEPKHDTPLELLDKVISDKGFRGFKMIPNRWYPCDEKLFPYYEKMAGLNAPCLFHSGILHFNTYSSRFCRPIYYEDLISVKNFRFALAHISWPWTDECFALYGQSGAMREYYGATSEMFIDATPGTPKIYREEVFRKILSAREFGRIMYGSDMGMHAQGIEKDPQAFINNWKNSLKRDIDILTKLGASEEAKTKFFSGNFEKFFRK